MNDAATLKSMSMLALEHDVDFEVFHGETTHKDKRVRAQMILSLNGCPEVRVRFGDKKHDQRVSTVNLSRNDKIPVKLADLISAMEQNSTGNHWFRLMDKETPLFNIEITGDGLIVITGTVEEEDKDIDPHEIDGEIFDSYRISLPNILLNTGSSKLVTAAPTTFHAAMAQNTFAQSIGKEVTVVGEYVFPDRIRIVDIKD